MMNRLPDATRLAAAVRTGTILAAFAVAVLVAFVATARLTVMVDNRWQTFPGPGGVPGLLLALGPAVAVVAAIAAIRRAPDALLERWTPLAPLLVLVVLRVGAILAAPTHIPADNDPRYLHELAVGVLDGGNPLVSHRPMGYSTTLAALYAVFGERPFLAEVLNLACAVLAGWALYAVARWTWGVRAAAGGLLLYAVVPSQVLMVTAIFTETMYGAVLLAVITVAVAAVASGRVAPMLGAGLLLAASQYVRPLSLAFLPIFAAAPTLIGLRWPRAGLLALAVTAAFVVALVPVAVHNVTTHGALSLATSSYGGWSVFVGANQEHDGRFNRDDQAILRETPGRSVWERSEVLGREGLARITSDPGGFAELAVRKFRVLWADDTYAVTNAFPAWSTESVRYDALRLLSQAIYALVTVLAAIGLWRARRAPSAATLIIAGILVVVAAAHIVVEVQPRYHAYVVPLLCVFAGFAAAGRSATADEVP
jgi:hypothetical protein